MGLSKEEEIDHDIDHAKFSLESAIDNSGGEGVSLVGELEKLRSADAEFFNLQSKVDDILRSIPGLISALTAKIDYLSRAAAHPEELGSEDQEWQSDAHGAYLEDLDGVRREATLVFENYSSDTCVWCGGLIPAVEGVAEAVQALTQALTAKIDYLTKKAAAHPEELGSEDLARVRRGTPGATC
jgi:hypothetical protein